MKGEVGPGADENIRVLVVVHVHVPRDRNPEAPHLPVRRPTEPAPVQDLGQLQSSFTCSCEETFILYFKQVFMQPL